MNSEAFVGFLLGVRVRTEKNLPGSYEYKMESHIVSSTDYVGVLCMLHLCACVADSEGP